jgi:hypothetical protein
MKLMKENWRLNNAEHERALIPALATPVPATTVSRWSQRASAKLPFRFLTDSVAEAVAPKRKSCAGIRTCEDVAREVETMERIEDDVDEEDTNVESGRVFGLDAAIFRRLNSASDDDQEKEG